MIYLIPMHYQVGVIVFYQSTMLGKLRLLQHQLKSLLQVDLNPNIFGSPILAPKWCSNCRAPTYFNLATQVGAFHIIPPKNPYNTPPPMKSVEQSQIKVPKSIYFLWPSLQNYGQVWVSFFYKNTDTQRCFLASTFFIDFQPMVNCCVTYIAVVFFS